MPRAEGERSEQFEVSFIMLARLIRSTPAMVKALRTVAVAGVGLAACVIAPPAAQANSKYAGIVVDAKTGEVLYSNSADAARYPASLTKIMTLYILFEELDAGRVKLSTPFTISRYAASRPPSKLGLRAGSTISVRNAIGALVTKSANDIAATVGENIEGSQEAFARRMTQTAHRLGMRNTTFRNASGLPDASQKTTARDMSILGRAIQDHFPKYYRYFSMRVFKYKGRRFGNHNKLLGRVKGVDGIKTGYTRASGFNLVSSVKHRNREIVAVVMGGRTGRSRDAQMRKLIAEYLPKASSGKRTAPLMAGRKTGGTMVLANAPLPVAKPAVAAALVAALPRVPPVEQAPAAPIEVRNGRALPPAPGQIVTASAAPAPHPAPTPAARISAAHALERTAASNGPLSLDDLAAGRLQAPASKPQPVSGNVMALLPPARIPDAAAAAESIAKAAPRKAPASGSAMVATHDVTTTGSVTPVRHTGWQIQIAATPTEAKARDLLEQAKLKTGRVLADRVAYTETVEARGETLYRARFVGFNSQASAAAACRSLKKAKFACYHLHQ